MPNSNSNAALPQLSGTPMVTDGGLETELIFHRGYDLPHFAAFPLLDTERGRADLLDYYDGYARVAQAVGAGLLLETPTWRANPDWGAQLGYGPVDLRRVNGAAVALLAELRRDLGAAVDPVLVSGQVGPRGDGYRPGEPADPDVATRYHTAQIEAFADAGADMVTALTIVDVGEAIGIVRAARRAGLPVAMSFTVETDGNLPGGTSLAEAIGRVDDTAPPDYYLVNCAHPDHVQPATGRRGDWRDRVVGMRYNASRRSHAELDEAAELDAGDPAELAAGHRLLRSTFPNLTVVGGCCGTDARHVAALWDADAVA